MHPQIYSFSNRELCRTLRWLLAAVAMLAAADSAMAQSEDGIKCAFIYNFAKFATWPDSAFAGGSAPITVGFVGADALADTFEQNITGKFAGGRSFSVKKFSGAAGTEGCQIVYVGDGGLAGAVVTAAKGKPVLTIGASDGFDAAGGMINFVNDSGKVRFDLDLNAVGAAGLKLDAKLRQVARNVKGG